MRDYKREAKIKIICEAIKFVSMLNDCDDKDFVEDVLEGVKDKDTILLEMVRKRI